MIQTTGKNINYLIIGSFHFLSLCCFISACLLDLQQIMEPIQIHMGLDIYSCNNYLEEHFVVDLYYLYMLMLMGQLRF